MRMFVLDVRTHLLQAYFDMDIVSQEIEYEVDEDKKNLFGSA